ncbi:MAG: hypothetical protein JXR84_04135 [Anaerolineae bacterium]|nr:hypothetical protein [Anaerolineae bacterium]
MNDVLVMTVPEFEENAHKIAGKKAIVTVAGHGPLWPRGGPYSLVMIWLHPGAEGTTWVDSSRQVVMTAAHVREWELNGAVVFLGTCYGMENTAMVQALFAAGASAIVAGPGENFGGTGGILAGADVLATALRGALQSGVSVGAAWNIARMYAKLAALRKMPGADDALEFVMIKPGDKMPIKFGGKAGCFGGALALVVLLIGLLHEMLAPSLLTFDSPVSPVDTPTPQPTYTPWWEPIGTEVPWPTPTACISGFGCTPQEETVGIYYSTYMPIVLMDYGWNWDSQVLVNGVLGVTNVVSDDAVVMQDWVLAGSKTLTFTLVEQWSASLVYGSQIASGGSVDVTADTITLTVNNSGYDVAINVQYDVLTGTFSTDTITRVLTIYANDEITPTVVTRTETLTHP